MPLEHGDHVRREIDSPGFVGLRVLDLTVVRRGAIDA